jgi:hypothetical protein
MRSDTSVVDAIFSLSHDVAQTATMTIASPAVVTMGVAGRGHGLVAGSPFKFTTTGALPTGVTAGTQYYVLATGLTETTFQFSATNGGAAINSSGTQSGTHTCWPGPQMPAGYDYYRRIASIVRTGAAIKAFQQYGDEFLWSALAADVNVSNPGTSAVTRTLTVPVGILVTARMSVILTNNSNNHYALFSSMIVPDVTPSITAFTFGVGELSATAASLDVGGQCSIMTDTLAQIRTRANASGANCKVAIVTSGWNDTRGKY